MNPNLALSLSFEGVRLLHRAPGGWTLVGEIAADAADFAGDLALLRKTALGLEPGGLRTKILLITDWIKTFTIDNPRATDAEVRAAIDGSTPYALDELVFDHSRGGGRTYIATVTRQHLEEAEAFATEHRLQPVAFAAALPESSFRGEAFFGETRLARTLLAEGEAVERDPEPTLLPQRRAGAERIELVDDDAADVEVVHFRHMPLPSEPPKPDAPAALAEALAKLTAAEPITVPPVEEPQPTPSPPPVADPPVSAVIDAVADDDVAEPPLADVTPPPAQPASDDVIASVLASEAQPAGDSEGATSTSTSTPTPPASAPEPIFASRTRPTRGATRPSEGQGSAPLAATGGRGPLPPPAERPPGRIEPSLRRGSTAGIAGDASHGSGRTMNAPGADASAPSAIELAMPVAPEPSTLEPSPPLPAEPSPAVDPIERAVQRITAEASTTPRDLRTQPVSTPTTGKAGEVRGEHRSVPSNEAARMTVFGARKEAEVERSRNRSRLFGLLLTVILLVVMTAVGVWAAVSEAGLAGLWGDDTPRVETVMTPADPLSREAEPVDEAAAVSPAPTDTQASTTIPESMPDAASAAAAVDAVAAALVEVARADEVETDLDAPAAAPEGVAIGPTEADRIYAATGVWLRSPRLTDLPVAEALGDLVPNVTLAADSTLDSDGDRSAAPLALDTATPDAVLMAQREPPPPGAVFERDERGMILATPEGTLMPDGLLVVAGSPLVIPPTRPGPTAAAPREAAPETSTAMETAPSQRPRLRPENAVLPETEAEPETLTTGMAPVPTLTGTELDPAATGALTFAEQASAIEAATTTAGGVSLDGLRPPARPAGAATSADPALPELAAYDGPRPGLRPEGLAPDALPETPDPAIDAALAALDPVEPGAEVAPADAPVVEMPTAPDLASTLAGIMADAPDPLAGATAQAVASVPRPGTRPQNFASVVSNQLGRQARASQPQAQAQGGGGSLQPEEQAESEAEVASAAAAAPSGPTAASVAQAATFADVMALREMNLIGVYGQPGARRALVRMGNGRYLRVGVGDGLDGGQVTAIGDNALNYSRRGRTETLVIPGG